MLKKILVVDDHEYARDIIKTLIRPHLSKNHILIEASGAYEAKAHILGSSLIITDYEMPNGNGFELISEVRSLSKDVPVILISASLEISEKSALSKGANHFIDKTYIASMLCQVVQKYI